jgi:methylated-DNA-[protein]-cysteine S-methyltransferase
MAGDLFYVVFHTAAGWAGLLGSEAGLRCATLPQPTEAEVNRLLGIDNSPAVFSPRLFHSLVERMQAYYDGHRVDFDDQLDLSGSTGFQRSVWRATKSIPYGETRSYGWIAGQIGRPKAPRAVGQALKRNPIPVIIPCHRVIGSDGKLGGFGDGLEMKKYLLRLEKPS